MPRLRANSVIGTLDLELAAPASPGATETWQQAGTDVLPGVSTSDPAHPYVIAVTLDPAELNGAAEIIHITSRAGGATTNTIKRGQEGTTGRVHPAGTKWVVGPTALDFSETDYVKIEADEQGYDALEVWVKTGYDNVWRRRFGIENPDPATDALVDTDIHSTVVNLGDASASVSSAGTKLVVRQPAGNSANLIEAHKKGEADAVLFTLDSTGTVTISNADTASPAVALRVKARTDAQPTFTLDENGSMAWGPGGSSATDVALARTGTGAMTYVGNLDVWGTVSTTSTPTAASHLATKAYVDSAAVGLRWVSTACALATTTNITLSGEQTIDGTMTSTTRVLVKDQSTASQNGIYTTGSGPWVRVGDFDQAAEVTKGAAVFVEGGTLNAGTAWTQTATVTTVNTDALVWAQMAGGASVNAGTGLAKVGNTISVASAGIDSSMLASSAVTTAKVADNAVTTAKLVDGNVTTAKIADTAVTAAKITDDTITPAKLKANGTTASGTTVYGGGASWVAANGHNHDASAITTGTFAVQRVGTNSGNANAFLNGVGQFVAQSTTGQPLVIVSTVAQLRTAATADNAHIYVTAGDYVLSASGAGSDTGALALNKSNQLWELHPDAVISQSTGSASVLNITGSNITWRGGVIDGGDDRTLPRDGRTSSNGGVNAVVIGAAANRITLHGTTIQNARNSAVTLNSPTSVRLSELYILNSGSTAIAGTTGADNALGMVVEGCLIDRTGFQATVNYHGGGIKLKGDENSDAYTNRGMRIIGNEIRQPYMNIIQSEGANNTGNECIVYQYNDAIDGLVANNVCAGGSIGISFSRVNGCTITGNTVYGFSKLGLEMAASQFCTAAGNVIDGGMAANRVPTPGDNHVGIVVWSAHPDEGTYPQDNTVIGNTIRNLRARNDTAGIKVQLTGGVEARAVVADNIIAVRTDATGIMVLEANRVTIANNQIRCNEAGAATTNTAAIKLQLGAAASGRYVITGNQLSSANRGLAIVGTGSYQDVACMSNVINSDVNTPFFVDGPTTGARNVWGANVGSATAATRPTGWVAP